MHTGRAYACALMQRHLPGHTSPLHPHSPLPHPTGISMLLRVLPRQVSSSPSLGSEPLGVLLVGTLSCSQAPGCGGWGGLEVQ